MAVYQCPGCEYQYDEENGLILQHINAGFNCCSEVSANITIGGNLITVEETESGDFCYCLCLYDVEYRIEDLPPGEYTIKFVELCLEEEPEPPAMEFVALQRIEVTK